jgi:Tol biopolymer transport system component
MVTLVSSGGRIDWSPQNLIAFSKLGSGNFNAEVYVMHADATNQVCLTCGKPAIPHLSNDQPAWTPNGKYVLFQSVDPALYDALKLPEAQKRQFTEGGAGIDNNLWVVTADGQRFTQLTHVTQGEATLHAHFSTDGKRLYWTTRAPGTGLARLTMHWALATADFVDDATGPHLVNTNVFTPLGVGPFYESHAWAPDDSYVLFSSGANPSPPSFPACACALSIWKLNLATGQTTELTDTTNVWNEHAYISPDGRKIAWLSSQGYPFTPSANWAATLKLELWIMNADGSNKQQLTSFNSPGSPEFTAGHRIILADGGWNPQGDKYINTLADVGPGTYTVRIILIEFNAAQ